MEYALLIVAETPSKTMLLTTEILQNVFDTSPRDIGTPERLNDSVRLYSFPAQFVTFARHMTNVEQQGLCFQALLLNEKPSWITSGIDREIQSQTVANTLKDVENIFKDV